MKLVLDGWSNESASATIYLPEIRLFVATLVLLLAIGITVIL